MQNRVDKFNLFLIPALLTSIFVYCASFYPFDDIGIDSLQYIQYANQIVNGTFFTPSEENIRALTIRTPAFPILLSIGIMLFGNIYLALKSVHIFALGLTVFLLWNFYSKKLNAACFAVACLPLIGTLDLFSTFATEFISICLLIILGLQIKKTLTLRTERTAVLASLILGILPLVRPVFLIFSISTIALILLVILFCKSNKKFMLILLCSIIFPIILQFSLTFLRTGSIGFVPLWGLGRFTLASTISVNLHSSSIDPVASEFANYINQNKFTVTIAQLKDCYKWYGISARHSCIIPFYKNADLGIQYAELKSWHIPFADKIYAEYARSALFDNIGTYYQFLMLNLQVFWFSFFITFFLSVISFILYLKKHTLTSDFLTASILGMIHWLQIIFIGVNHPVMSRYFIVTWIPFLIFFVIAIISAYFGYSKDRELKHS